MKRGVSGSIVLLAGLLIAATFGGAAAPPASAGCYITLVANHGNYPFGCGRAGVNLTEDYVLAEPKRRRPGTRYTWCANLNPAVATGEYEDESCTMVGVDSTRFIFIVLPLTKLLPEPTGTAPVSFTTKQSLSLVTSGGEKVECKKGSGSGTFTSPTLGTGKNSLEECKGPLGSTCTGEGDSTGRILTEGTVHYLVGLEMQTGGTTYPVGGLVILQREFHFTCEALGVKQLVLVRGCVAGRGEVEESLTKSVPVTFAQWTTGEASILEILPPGTSKEVSCSLEASVNGKAFTLSAIVGEATLEKWTQSGKEIEVLLMHE